jgi:tRNA(His) guanylyltransferase
MADDIGDRCKRYELAEAGRRAMPGIPLLARLDGRAFHTFTRGLRRPYDERMSACMVETTRHLVDDLQALIGYTQSDEITLLWYVPSGGPAEYPFDGRFQKVASVAAGLASTVFYREMLARIPEKSSATPCFDARVWQVPTKEDALEVFVWREDDASKNSLQMAVRALYTAKECHGKGGAALHDLLHAKGVNWNDYPAFFKRGTYVRRESVVRTFSEAERARIPEAHRPAEGATYVRTEVRPVELPPIRRVGNALAVLFEGAAPADREP